MRIFIADDSEVLRERLCEILSEIRGIKIVGQKGDATEAIEAVDRLKPEIVILDIQMPGGNGIYALEVIKKGSKPPIVIMFTNFPYLQYRKKCMDAGADFFFYKSTEFNKLIEVIKKLALMEDLKK